MSHAPFDGVLLEDPRPPVPGALALQLHLRVAARRAGGELPGGEVVAARARACRELLAHGLTPERLRALAAHGLELGDPRRPRSLANLAAHLEAYLAEVAKAGFMEPDEALWRAVDLQQAGKRGLWIERGAEDGPILAGAADLAPARLRPLLTRPELGGVVFRLATRRGDGSSGLFGSGQPLVDWFLEGLEAHGQALPVEPLLECPEGWGLNPWGAALEGLFQGPLDLPAESGLRRGLVEGPGDLPRAALEQVCAWVEQGIPPREICVVHPEPQRLAPLLAPLLAAEGIPMQLRGGLRSLGEGFTWSPFRALLLGLERLDPIALSSGLRASRDRDLRAWGELLAGADQGGNAPVLASFPHLDPEARQACQELWTDLESLARQELPAWGWIQRLEDLAGRLRLDVASEDFYAPLGLLRGCWDETPWGFGRMLQALDLFLEAARCAPPPRPPEGLRLISPGSLLDDWEGATATLALDLSEGAWPRRPQADPDLDWERRAALNQALLRATQAGESPAFPPALQRFRLPRSEQGDQVPRAFQQEAYAFNKLLALTARELVALSPGQDAQGRPLAQGLFWNALEGAGAWAPDASRAHSRLRLDWEAPQVPDLVLGRALAAQARPEGGEAAHAPEADRVPGILQAWLGSRSCTSPTALEGLARCPFRSLAQRVWGLETFDGAARQRMAAGTLAHGLLEEALRPHLGARAWNLELLQAAGGAEGLGAHLRGLWEQHRAALLAKLKDLPAELHPQAARELEALLPLLAATLAEDLEAGAPTPWEMVLLFPQHFPEGDVRKKAHPLLQGWTRELLGLEGLMGPMDLDLGQGRTLPVAGIIDRLERWEHPETGLRFLRVLDYKTIAATGLQAYRAPGAPFGSHLQTPLYALMAQERHGEPASAVLLALRSGEGPDGKPLQQLAAQEKEEGGWKTRLRASLAALWERLEKGDLPPTPGDHCLHCPLGALCGRPVDLSLAGDEEGEGA